MFIAGVVVENGVRNGHGQVTPDIQYQQVQIKTLLPIIRQVYIITNMSVEVVYPNDDDPKKNIKTTIESVNEYLKGNTAKGEEAFTVQGIAETLGVDNETLEGWTINDADFLGGLNKYKELQDQGIFRPDEEFGNRADAMMIALLILETKKKYKEE